MGVWHPDRVLPPLKCILISCQLSCGGSKLSALTEFPREFGDCCKNPSSNLLAVTLISGRIGCLLRKSQAEQPDNSWLSGHCASYQKAGRNFCFPAWRVWTFGPWLYPSSWTQDYLLEVWGEFTLFRYQGESTSGQEKATSDLATASRFYEMGAGWKLPPNLWQQAALVRWANGWRWLGHKPTFPLPSVPVSHGAFVFPRPKATCASFRPKFAASGSVRWLCKSVQSTSNCSQWDAAGAEVVTGTNLITRLRLPCGCVLARVSGGCAPRRVGACRWTAIRRATAVMSYSPNKQICFRATAPDLGSRAGFYLEEIIFVYRTNKTALLATALGALVITWISGQPCHSYSTKLINLYNENRTVTNTDPTSKDGSAAVCWPEF